MALFYLSFADEVFRGVVVLEAPDFFKAVTLSHILGINPGGEIAGWEIPTEFLDRFPAGHRGKLLATKDDVERAFGPAQRIGDLTGDQDG